MAGALKLLIALILIISVASTGSAAVQQHVVGGDQGWDVSSDIASWSSARSFRVGDLIWFGYKAEEESVVELRSIEEYISCDLSNPLSILTDGLNKIPLEKQGFRYFTSGNTESCQNGLKLHVEVQSQDKYKLTTVGSSEDGYKMVVATGPSPSISAHDNEFCFVLLIGAVALHVAMAWHENSLI
ncbi:hypothetical protein DCAR_0831635 [Daucus carota subsp. sativus]|uniref:Phytocyanin domain-containing protein n=1 Tax=Daucus carota subsp. sativus TaxID=79200 RepID=A0AAF0XTI8_DAUCS|nr:PREDICTED: mavicyanin-like [Daucus carota subsp. sativus]WOH12136.1 hypothetical protein DCAR_0831635 [Daucus carota subsp. sativus]